MSDSGKVVEAFKGVICGAVGAILAFQFASYYQNSRKKETLLNASDFNAIQNTIHNYLHYLDNGQNKEFAQLWTKNGSCEIVKFKKLCAGHKELEALCTNISQKFNGYTHWEANITINIIDENTVSTKSYWKSVFDGKISSQGTHEDILVREGKEWLFQTRKIYHK